MQVLPQVQVLVQYFLAMPEPITCPQSISANKLISPYVEILEPLFFSSLFPAYLQRMLKQVCLRAFQGTVYRSDRCAFRCNRSKSGLKK